MTHPGPAGRPRVLVTGATRGIGRSTARLLRGSHEVIVSGRDRADVAAVAADLGTAQLTLDLADTAAIAAGCAGLGDVDAVVHCAGVEGTAGSADLDPALLRDVLAVNLAGPVELTRALLPGLRRRGGHVVLLNSTAALGAFPDWAAYSASKAGLRSYADTLRLEQQPHGVRVTSIFPGRTDTGMQRQIAAKRGATFDPATAMSPDSVATAVQYVLTAPRDLAIGELTLTPFPAR